jgi:hypothetical protein
MNCLTGAQRYPAVEFVKTLLEIYIKKGSSLSVE